ncbi:MAG: hypothetical protein NPIRA03_37010 [Nitrospirales bacterium]|nr:MAG: hypothetical protein NPIRA03_37010 [Nitrospirales bacterium]
MILPKDYGSGFVLTLFTNNVEIARLADEAGIDRIGLDLEVLGKIERQDPSKTWISDHLISEIPAVRRVLKNAQLFVRTNPLNTKSKYEIDRLVDLGAEVLMLPMFSDAVEAQQWIDMVAGRAETSLLVETASAAKNIKDITKVSGVDEIHVGLNDLHLDLKMNNHFEVLVSPLMEKVSTCVHEAGINFGFGGIARVNDETLPISSDLIYAQYPRLNADRALVSRIFLSPDYRLFSLTEEVAKFRQMMTKWSKQSCQDLYDAKDILAKAILEMEKSSKQRIH